MLHKRMAASYPGLVKAHPGNEVDSELPSFAQANGAAAEIRATEDVKRSKYLNWYEDSRKGRTMKQNKYEELRKLIYTMADQNGNKSITKKEFVGMLTQDGHEWEPMTEAEASELYSDITNGHGRISFAKLDGWLTNKATRMAIEKYREAKGDNRNLEKDTFVHYMRQEGVSNSRAKKLWDYVDQNHNGKVTLVEFRDWACDMLKLEVMEDHFNL